MFQGSVSDVFLLGNPAGQATISDADRDGKDYFLNKYPNQKTNFLIDCYECEFIKETNTVVPKSAIPY